MTKENHCYKNALAERINGILKDEYLLYRTFRDFAHAEKDCKKAITEANERKSKRNNRRNIRYHRNK